MCRARTRWCAAARDQQVVQVLIWMWCAGAQRAEDLVLTEFAFCVIDEVDSILIDEARTPLIISGPAEKSSEKYYQVRADWLSSLPPACAALCPVLTPGAVDPAGASMCPLHLVLAALQRHRVLPDA